MAGLKSKGVRVVDEVSYGLYVWQMPNGKYIGDDDGNLLNVVSMKGDIQKMAILREAVKGFGITEGRPVFMSGARRINDEEYEEQKERLRNGLIPDPYDLPALAEAERHRKWQSERGN